VKANFPFRPVHCRKRWSVPWLRSIGHRLMREDDEYVVPRPQRCCSMEEQQETIVGQRRSGRLSGLRIDQCELRAACDLSCIFQKK